MSMSFGPGFGRPFGLRRSPASWGGLGLEEATNADERGGTLANARRERFATTVHVKVFRLRAVSGGPDRVGTATAATSGLSTLAAHRTDTPIALGPRPHAMSGSDAPRRRRFPHHHEPSQRAGGGDQPPEHTITRVPHRRGSVAVARWQAFCGAPRQTRRSGSCV